MIHAWVYHPPGVSQCFVNNIHKVIGSKSDRLLMTMSSEVSSLEDIKLLQQGLLMPQSAICICLREEKNADPCNK